MARQGRFRAHQRRVQEQAVAIIKPHGREAAEEWLTGLRAFGKVYSNNMVKAVENGEVATPYW